MKFSDIIFSKLPIMFIFNYLNFCRHAYIPVASTMMVVLSLPMGLVTVHMYAPLSLVVILSMEKSARNTALVLV